MNDLRAALPGTWQLATYEIDDGTGTVVDRPFGDRPVGTLVYTSGGHVSVHAMAPDRPRCGTRRPVECSDELKLAAYDSYFGYSGTWALAGDRVVHHVATSCFPDWNGADLVRRVVIEGDTLLLVGVPTEPPVPLHPVAPRIPVLSWVRDPRS